MIDRTERAGQGAPDRCRVSERVEKGERCHETVIRTGVKEFVELMHIRRDIIERKHRPFRPTGRPGRENDCHQIIRLVPSDPQLSLQNAGGKERVEQTKKLGRKRDLLQSIFGQDPVGFELHVGELVEKLFAR